MAAADARKTPSLPTFFRHVAARGARLRSTSGIDLDRVPSGPCCLLADQRRQYSEPGIQERPVQAGLRADIGPGCLDGTLGAAGHPAQIQRFECDAIEAPDDRPADLVQPIASRVRLSPSFARASRRTAATRAGSRRLRTRPAASFVVTVSRARWCCSTRS